MAGRYLMLFWHFYLCRWLGIFFFLTAFNTVSLLCILASWLQYVIERPFFAHIYSEVPMALVFEYLYFPSRCGEFSALIFMLLVYFRPFIFLMGLWIWLLNQVFLDDAFLWISCLLFLIGVGMQYFTCLVLYSWHPFLLLAQANWCVYTHRMYV